MVLKKELDKEYFEDEKYFEAEEYYSEEANFDTEYLPKQQYLNLMDLTSKKNSKVKSSPKGKRVKRKFTNADITADAKAKRIIEIESPASPTFENREEEENIDNSVDNSVIVTFTNESIDRNLLQNVYGKFYVESQSTPRKYLIIEEMDPLSSKILFESQSTSESSSTMKVTFLAFGNDFDGDVLNLINAADTLDFHVFVDMFYPRLVSKATGEDSLFSKTEEIQTKSETELIIDSGFYCYDQAECTNSTFPPALECSNCFDEIPSETHLTTINKCGHSFCNDCWEEYFKAKITQELTNDIKCLAYKCESAIDVVTVLSKVTWDLLSLYVKGYTKQLIQKSKNIELCPNNDCQHVIIVDEALIPPVPSASEILSRTLEVQCAQCHRSWCFTCKKTTHWPLSCQTYAKLDKITEQLVKYGNVDSSGRPLKMNVLGKHCPRCGKFIEKNGGCYVMMCICSTEGFCWNCTTPFSEHGNGCKQDTKEYAFTPILSPKEKRLMEVLTEANWNDMLNKLWSQIRNRKCPFKVMFYQSALESLKILKKSSNVVRMLYICKLVEPKLTSPIIMRSCRRIKFSNELLMQSLYRGIHCGKMNANELKIHTMDIESILKSIAENIKS